MSLVARGSVARVVDAEVLTELAERFLTIAGTVSARFSDAHDRWSHLRGVFNVTGAEGIFSVLDRPNNDASDFAGALTQARNALYLAATQTVPQLTSGERRSKPGFPRSMTPGMMPAKHTA